ncbi:MAG: YcxB family protein [Trichormus sp.]
MSIQFSGTWTEQQYNRFQQLCMPAWSRWVFKWLPWFWLGFMLVKLVFAPGYIVSGWIVFDVLMVLYFLVLIPKLRERQIKRAWESNKMIKGEISGVVDQDSIIWRNAYGETRYPWEVLLKYREALDMILIYIAINQVLILPHNFFQSEEDWQQFRQIVIEKLPKK